MGSGKTVGAEAEAKTLEELRALSDRAAEFCRILEAIDDRCIHVDGPVPPTLKMATNDELAELYALAREVKKAGVSLPALLDERERLRAALKLVRGIIVEASQTGFNCYDGDWAERLYASQSDTYRALQASTLPSDQRQLVEDQKGQKP
jgi:hypothetical protein